MKRDLALGEFTKRSSTPLNNGEVEIGLIVESLKNVECKLSDIDKIQYKLDLINDRLQDVIRKQDDILYSENQNVSGSVVGKILAVIIVILFVLYGAGVIMGYGFNPINSIPKFFTENIVNNDVLDNKIIEYNNEKSK